MKQKTSPNLSFFANLMVCALYLVCLINAQVEAQRRPNPVTPAPNPTSDKDAQIKQILDSSLLVIKGNTFPKLAPISSPPVGPQKPSNVPQSCCQPHDTRSINGVAKIDLSTPKGYSTDKFIPQSGYAEAIYSPPSSCWVISSYYRQTTDANDPYEAMDDAQPPIFTYIAKTEYESVLNEIKNYVGKLNILDKYKADLNLKLEEFVKSYSMYSNSISTSHGQIRHRARVQGRGAFNGSSWYRAQINTTETCCPPEIRDKAELKKTLMGWTDQVATKWRNVIDSKQPPPTDK